MLACNSIQPITHPHHRLHNGPSAVRMPTTVRLGTNHLWGWSRHRVVASRRLKDEGVRFGDCSTIDRSFRGQMRILNGVLRFDIRIETGTGTSGYRMKALGSWEFVSDGKLAYCTGRIVEMGHSKGIASSDGSSLKGNAMKWTYSVDIEIKTMNPSPSSLCTLHKSLQQSLMFEFEPRDQHPLATPTFFV